MNKFLTTLLLGFVTASLTAGESTNRPPSKVSTNKVQRAQQPTVPAHILTRNKIKAQIDAIEQRDKQLSQQADSLSRRRALEGGAGQSTAATNHQLRQIEQARAELRKAKAQLELQAMNLRQTYGIPEDKPKRTR